MQLGNDCVCFFGLPIMLIDHKVRTLASAIVEALNWDWSAWKITNIPLRAAIGSHDMG